MNKWEYRVSYVDFRGRISTDGVEFVRQSGEHRTGFVRKFLDVQGEDGWELVGINHLRYENAYFIFRRPKGAAPSGEAVA
ncbi:MAG: hypothetical protein EXR51_09400 [Dehalococcoidia bacterium]|nr:hypothetical protein [Dehalococcoidia bacterium]